MQKTLFFMSRDGIVEESCKIKTMYITTYLKKVSKLTIVVVAMLSTLALSVSSSVIVRAADDGCAGIQTTVIKCKTDNGNPVIGVLLQIINFMAVGVGIAVVGGIIWGGLIYASSNGDSGKVKEAKTIIVNAIIGLLLFFFMYAIINFLVPGGVFS